MSVAMTYVKLREERLWNVSDPERIGLYLSNLVAT
jgi:hypothetical protein